MEDDYNQNPLIGRTPILAPSGPAPTRQLHGSRRAQKKGGGAVFHSATSCPSTSDGSDGASLSQNTCFGNVNRGSGEVTSGWSTLALGLLQGCPSERSRWGGGRYRVGRAEVRGFCPLIDCGSQGGTKTSDRIPAVGSACRWDAHAHAILTSMDEGTKRCIG